MELIKDKIDRFYSLIKDYVEGAPYTRYKSWEWCHKAFLDKKEEYNKSKDEQRKEEIVDYLALHLAFYLASWGMYRGSSYLLKRDYKTHKETVRIILEKKYKMLWDYEPKDNNVDKVSELLFKEDEGIYDKIKKSYNGYDAEDNDGDDEESNEGDTPSDTLITKILMGTFGCVPAFDRFLKKGLTQYKKSNNDYKFTQKIDAKTFKELTKFAIKNKNYLKVDEYTIVYPPMKCVDMFFWEIGYEMDIVSGLNNSKIKQPKKEKLIQDAKRLKLCDENLEFKEKDIIINQINEKN